MKVYFAGSIRGDSFPEQKEVFAAIVTAIREAKCVLLSEHAVATGVPEILDDDAIYERDMNWIDDCDLIVAEVTAPSTGVGYEIAYALYQWDTPILCLHKEGVRISAMLNGNRSNIEILAYQTPEDAARLVHEFLGN